MVMMRMTRGDSSRVMLPLTRGDSSRIKLSAAAAAGVKAGIRLPQLSLSAFSSPGIASLTLPQFATSFTGHLQVDGAMTLPQFAVQGESSSVFIFTAKTTAAAEPFTLPIYNGGTYNFLVDWGDSSFDTITAWDDAAVTHTYATAGTYTISITGVITGFRFNNAGHKTKIYNISSWGPLLLGSLGGYFWGCTNLTVTATDVLNTSLMTSFASMFRGCTSLTTVPSINSWNTAAVTSMMNAFSSSSFNQDISGWNVAAVTNMISMFAFNSSFNQDISSWNVAAVTNMASMFESATSFNQDISGWNVAAVTNMSVMFQSATSFNQDISSWNVAAVTNMAQMFKDATSFNQDISSWNVAAVTNMAQMFQLITLSTVNYDALLTGWEAQAVQSGVVFHGGNSKYSAGAPATARASLITVKSWTITDGGLA